MHQIDYIMDKTTLLYKGKQVEYQSITCKGRSMTCMPDLLHAWKKRCMQMPERWKSEI